MTVGVIGARIISNESAILTPSVIFYPKFSFEWFLKIKRWHETKLFFDPFLIRFLCGFYLGKLNILFTVPSVTIR